MRGGGVRGQRAHVPGKSHPLTFCGLILTAVPSQDSVTTRMSVKTNPINKSHCLFYYKFGVNDQKELHNKCFPNL